MWLPKCTSNNFRCSCSDGHQCVLKFSGAKFCFSKICNDDDGSSLQVQTFTAIASTDVNSLSTIKQCRFLQSSFPSLSSLVDEVLCKSRVLSLSSDWRLKRTQDIPMEHPSLLYPLKIAKENKWMKFWDWSLDHREKGTRLSSNSYVWWSLVKENAP